MQKPLMEEQGQGKCSFLPAPGETEHNLPGRNLCTTLIVSILPTSSQRPRFLSHAGIMAQLLPPSLDRTMEPSKRPPKISHPASGPAGQTQLQAPLPLPRATRGLPELGMGNPSPPTTPVFTEDINIKGQAFEGGEGGLEVKWKSLL